MAGKTARKRLKSAARRADSAPLRGLAKPIDARGRARVSALVGALLDWQATLARWPRLSDRGFPDATPFVAIYARGRLRGCFASFEGSPAERLARATLLALHDIRFGGIAEPEREQLAAEVSYASNIRRIELADVATSLEPATHGVALRRDRTQVISLLPSVAREEGIGANELVQLLARKAGASLGEIARGELFSFETQDVVVRPHRVDGARVDPTELAARWLAQRVHADGRIDFGIDPKTTSAIAAGEFHHGRAAIVIQALARQGGAARRIGGARKWLSREIKRALAGKQVEAWPEHPAQVAGTLALAGFAGLDVVRPLRELARNEALGWVPWHAAQVVASLGSDAPRELWAACVRDLEPRPWAPWTLIAARRLGDEPVIVRAEKAVIDSIRDCAPYRGGADVRPIPELALTALAIESLAESRSRSARAAATRAREFLLRWQLGPDHLSAAFEPRASLGGFPLSPIAWYLRSDVTAHALLALL